MSHSAEASGACILVAEDDAMMRELIVTRLSIAGYRTLQARDGFEALKCLQEQRPDAMILDINMPRLDGFSVLSQMGLTGELDRAPTMILTARNQKIDVQRALQLGISDFLAKPFETGVLLTRVARLIRSAPEGAARRAQTKPLRVRSQQTW